MGFDMALRLEQHAKIAVCLDIIWLQSQGMLKVRHGVSELPLRLSSTPKLLCALA